ncbi:hypothetical protein V6N13_095246 [Hibiscus sabdariffa]
MLFCFSLETFNTYSQFPHFYGAQCLRRPPMVRAVKADQFHYHRVMCPSPVHMPLIVDVHPAECGDRLVLVVFECRSRPGVFGFDCEKLSLVDVNSKRSPCFTFMLNFRGGFFRTGLNSEAQKSMMVDLLLSSNYLGDVLWGYGKQIRIVFRQEEDRARKTDKKFRHRKMQVSKLHQNLRRVLVSKSEPKHMLINGI